MKRKMAYTTLTALAIAGAFLVGKSMPKDNYIPMETAISVEDIAEQYIGEDGYLTVELKDLSYQFDDKANANYADILADVPDTTQEHRENEIDLRNIFAIEDNESYYSIILNDGNEYIINK